jgi:hypothetical protein
MRCCMPFQNPFSTIMDSSMRSLWSVLSSCMCNVNDRCVTCSRLKVLSVRVVSSETYNNIVSPNPHAEKNSTKQYLDEFWTQKTAEVSNNGDHSGHFKLQGGEKSFSFSSYRLQTQGNLYKSC